MIYDEEDAEAASSRQTSQMGRESELSLMAEDLENEISFIVKITCLQVEIPSDNLNEISVKKILFKINTFLKLYLLLKWWF